MVLSDEECLSDGNEFHGVDSNEDDDDSDLEVWARSSSVDWANEGDAQSDAPGMSFAHQGHDQSPSKGSVRKSAKSAKSTVQSPLIRRSIPSNKMSMADSEGCSGGRLCAVVAVWVTFGL